MKIIRYIFCFDGVLSIGRNTLSREEMELRLSETEMGQEAIAILDPKNDWMNLVKGLHKGVRTYKAKHG